MCSPGIKTYVEINGGELRIQKQTYTIKFNLFLTKCQANSMGERADFFKGVEMIGYCHAK